MGLHRNGGTRKPARLMLVVLQVAISVSAGGCGNRCSDAYDAGYAAGLAAGSSRDSEAAQEVQKAQERKPDLSSGEQEASGWNSGPTATEVCGGGGVDIGTEHIEPGDSGCVRVFSDGRIERY